MRAFCCLDFFAAFFLAFRNLLLCIGSILNCPLIIMPTFHYNFLKIFHLSLKETFIQFHQNLFHIHSFLERICIKPCFFVIFITNEIFKILFNKRKVIRYYYFVNIYIVHGNRAFTLMKFVFFNLSVIIYQCFIRFLYIVLILFNVFNLYFSNLCLLQSAVLK